MREQQQNAKTERDLEKDLETSTEDSMNTSNVGIGWLFGTSTHDEYGALFGECECDRCKADHQEEDEE